MSRTSETPVLIVGGGAVGCVLSMELARRGVHAWFVLDEGEVANLAVAPGLRRRGVGSTLLDAAIRESQSRGVSNLYLEVRESNQSARRLYASRGFDEVSRRKAYYRSPVEDALILRRTLTR